MPALWWCSKTETCRSDIYVYFNVNFNVCFKLIKVYLLVSELYVSYFDIFVSEESRRTGIRYCTRSSSAWFIKFARSTCSSAILNARSTELFTLLSQVHLSTVVHALNNFPIYTIMISIHWVMSPCFTLLFVSNVNIENHFVRKHLHKNRLPVT